MAINKDIILLDTDKTKLYPLAHKDSGNNVIVDTYVKKAGDTMTGTLIIEGSAASNPLIVRGISGSDGNGNLGDLFLNRNGGVTYFGTSGGGHITTDGKSYSGNAATATKATQDGDGNTISTTYVKEAGDTMTGSLSFSNADIGVQRVGRSKSWHKGRDGALVKATSLSGYSPTISTKTNNGSWEIGAYDNSSYTDDLVFSYVKDTDYTNNTNDHTEIKFLENGSIVANLQGDVTGNVTGSSSLNVLKAGDTMSGNLFFANTNNTTTSGSTPLGIYGSVGENDGWRIVGLGSSNAGSLEIATNDDGNEPIYVRQYNGGGGSAGFVTIARTLTLLDASGNTTIPGSLHLSSDNDAAGGSLGSPPLIIGTSTAQHIEIDNNEILSKSNSTTPSILYLQDGTGGVVVAGSGGLSVNNGNLSVSGTITSTGTISATAGSIWAGTSGSTAAERQVGVQSGSGGLYMFSQASTSGSRGLYVPAHGSGSAKTVIGIDTNNNAHFYGASDSATSSSYTDYVSLVATNEIRFKNRLTSSQDIWFNYRWYEGSYATCAGYRFGNGNTALTRVYASGFYLDANRQAPIEYKNLFTGTIKGGESHLIDMTSCSRIRVYAMTWGVQHCFEVDLSDAGKAQSGHGLTDTTWPWQGGSTVPHRDGAGTSGGHLTYYSVSVKIGSDKKSMWVTAIGYQAMQDSYDSYETRLNNGEYYVYRVDGIN